MKISASDQVADWLCALPPQTKRRVRTALRALAKAKGDIKGLQGSLEGFNRLRIGGIRILFRQVSERKSSSNTPTPAM
jgi:mRNA-degrading endonuclease RelE of RelBE toxin-antitoxin system